MNQKESITSQQGLSGVDLQPVVASFQNTEEQLLRRYGSYERYESPSGNIITVLPTCSVSLSYLARENWKTVGPMGNFRSVYSVDALINGVHPHIVVKSPERVFTKEERLLSKGYPWWGGPRTPEKKVRIVGNPVVEAQAFWEAIMLLELHLHGIRAEIPQALIQAPDGKCEVIVNEIDVPFTYVETIEHSPKEEVIRAKTGLQPAGDWQGQNLMNDSTGHTWIIDVNRWEWPPYTDNFRKSLVQVIQNVNI